ncbi:MAG: c-type cytochrome [Bacilli bacterium]
MHRGKGMKFVGDSRVAINNRKPNIPKDYSEYPGRTEAFWPNFLLKEWLVGAVFLIGFLILTASHEPPLQRVADPTDTGYIPVPDWYFLFMYQLLKYTYASGDYNVLGAIIMPGLAFGALLFAPFIDNGPERRPSKRPITTGLMLTAFAIIFYLTWESVDQHDWEAAKKHGAIVKTVQVDTADPAYATLEKNTCLSCHGANLEGGPAAPKLQGLTLTADEIKHIAVNGSESGKMPAGIFKGTDEELQQIADFIVKYAEE